jgi:RNA polymerase sigma factor (sigma-70 family)
MYPQTRSMPQERIRHRFATTRWSLVVAAGGASPASSTALAELCEAYWYPAYAYLRRSGYSVDKAADLTQSFFTRMLEKRFLKDARSDRRRFRSFLLASLRHFVSNEFDRERAAFRGGNIVHVPLDFGTGEDRYQREPPDDQTPERIYERQWTLDVLDRAMSQLSAKYRRSGRHEMFVRLKPHLVGEEPAAYRELADALGVSEGSLRIAVHRLRKEFSAMLRDTIAETVERDEDVDDELQYLLRVVGRQH